MHRNALSTLHKGVNRTQTYSAQSPKFQSRPDQGYCLYTIAGYEPGCAKNRHVNPASSACFTRLIWLCGGDRLSKANLAAFARFWYNRAKIVPGGVCRLAEFVAKIRLPHRRVVPLLS